MRVEDSDSIHSPPISKRAGRRRNEATGAEGAGWVAIETLMALPDSLGLVAARLPAAAPSSLVARSERQILL
jgi:hypothetical protein